MQRCGASQKIERLKNETDFLVADACQFIVVQFADQLAVQPILAFAGCVQTSDQIHQRGLARAGRSHDRDVFAAVDANVHSPQSVNLLFRSHVVGLPQILGANHA